MKETTAPPWRGTVGRAVTPVSGDAGREVSDGRGVSDSGWRRGSPGSAAGTRAGAGVGVGVGVGECPGVDAAGGREARWAAWAWVGILLISASLLMPGVGGVLAGSLALCVLALWGQLPWPAAAQRLWRLKWVFLSMGVFFGWLPHAPTAGTPDAGWFPVWAGLAEAGLRILALALMVLWVSWLAHAFSSSAQVWGLARVLAPLRPLGVEGTLWAQRLFLTLQYFAEGQADYRAFGKTLRSGTGAGAAGAGAEAETGSGMARAETAVVLATLEGHTGYRGRWRSWWQGVTRIREYFILRLLHALQAGSEGIAQPMTTATVTGMMTTTTTTGMMSTATATGMMTTATTATTIATAAAADASALSGRQAPDQSTDQAHDHAHDHAHDQAPDRRVRWSVLLLWGTALVMWTSALWYRG